MSSVTSATPALDLKPTAFLSVCPHDTAKNLFSWFSLTTYLQRRLSEHIHFEPQDSFLEERSLVLSKTPQLVYANPYSAAVFSRDKGYQCLARPVGVFDESIVVASAGFDLASAPRPIKVASATDKLILHPLGVQVLQSLGLSTDDIEFVFVGTHLAAVKAVISGSASIGIVFNETWSGLSAATTGGLKVLGQSTGQNAFHCFMAAPAWAERLPQLQAILTSMHDDPKGRLVLDDLKVSGFEAVAPECVEQLQSLLAS